MNIRDTASKTTKWMLVGLGVFLFLEGLFELLAQFGPVGWPLIIASTLIIAPALCAGQERLEIKATKWKVVVRSVFALITLAGWSVGAWWGAAMMAMTHESDIPGSFYTRIAGWDSYGVFGAFVLIGVAGAARTLLLKRLQFISWTLFLLSASVLTLFALQMAESH